LVLSVGSGTGLLEALLQESLPALRIEGVEVSLNVNKYMPADRVNLVGGTWDIYPNASEAFALLFVYPRESSLVRRYLQLCSRTAHVILWLGPRADWPDLQFNLEDSEFDCVEEVADCGLLPYEMMVAISKLQPKT